jgi:hypothetical protein
MEESTAGLDPKDTPGMVALRITSFRRMGIECFIKECRLLAGAYHHMRNRNVTDKNGKRLDDFDRLLELVGLGYFNAMKMKQIAESEMIELLLEEVADGLLKLPSTLSTLYSISTASEDEMLKIWALLLEKEEGVRRADVELIKQKAEEEPMPLGLEANLPASGHEQYYAADPTLVTGMGNVETGCNSPSRTVTAALPSDFAFVGCLGGSSVSSISASLTVIVRKSVTQADYQQALQQLEELARIPGIEVPNLQTTLQQAA